MDRLPDVIKSYIQGQLAKGTMTLDELIADLQKCFPDEAASGDLPSRSAVGRYGQKLERRLAAIRASTEAAKIIHEQAGDKDDFRSGALTAMIQSELFESIMQLQEATDEEMSPAERVGLLADAAKNIATLTRSSVTLKKYQVESEERGRRQLLEEQKARLASMETKGGVTEETRNAIREALGIR
ncbi:MAG: phage protein Gp27 family protein [Rheinheimera sp.]|nr:phage protein Gp27 family protein [Rheinheimera sp.]